MMNRLLLQVPASVAVSLALVSAAFAQSTATINGKFVYDGKAPEPKVLMCNQEINKDQATCCQIKHVDESLVVGKDGAVANIVGYVRTTGLKVPAEIAAAHKEAKVLDNKNCRFEPHVIGIVQGQQLVLGNSDNVGHNSNIAAQQVNPIIPAGNQVPVNVKRVTLIPNEVNCNIHPWMKAWVVVRPNPFFSISAEDGTFEIKGLPVGKELEFQVWQEKSGFVTAVKVDGKATPWERGRFKQKLKAGENDLGEIKVAAKNFAK